MTGEVYRRKEVIGDCVLYLADCMDVLPTLGKVEAVVTDPPYGIGVAKNGRTGGGTGGLGTYIKKYEPCEWDNVPCSPLQIKAMQDISRYQIIFGGNYFELPPSRCWLVWDKQNTCHFADCELAWTNLNKPVRIIRHLWNGLARKGLEERFNHPTQKPVGVMEWCINQLPPDCTTILDPFMGSGSTGVACANMGRKFIGVEISEKYFDVACKRIEAAYRQGDLFIQRPENP